MEIMGQARIKEVSIAGVGKTALYIMLNELVTMKDGPSFEGMMKEDSLREDLPMIGGSPMVLDEEQLMEPRMKRPQKAEDEEDRP